MNQNREKTYLTLLDVFHKIELKNKDADALLLERHLFGVAFPSETIKEIAIFLVDNYTLIKKD